MVPSRALSGMK